MKTLVIVAHPNIERSVVNKRWIKELKQYPEKYTVHELYKAYPEGKIDIEKEQKLIESHGSLVLQFPLYWFNCPSVLKKWLDDVFTYGWAFGSNGGDHLMNRKVALAVSAGAKQSDYSESGRYRYTLEQILIPFKTTLFYCDADYRSIYAFYGKEGTTEEEEIKPEKNELTKSARGFVEFIDNL
jgi:putative NADPH-quinone reductase